MKLNHEVNFDVIEGYLVHQSLSGSGTNSHSAIDSHIGSTLNPHSVTASQVGNSIAQWNANELEGYGISNIQPTDGYRLIWNSATSLWTPQIQSPLPHASTHISTGSDPINNVVSGGASGLMSGTDKFLFDAYMPSFDEKNALIGSYGTPSLSNKYVTSTDPRLKHGHVIVVATSGGDFTSVKSAVDSITDASIMNPYVIKIEPGVYYEDPFSLKPFVSIIGQGDAVWSVSLITTSNGAHFITGAYASSLINVSVTGPSGSGYAAINYSETSPFPFMVYGILIRKGYYGIYCHPSGFGLINIYEAVPTYIGTNMNKFIYVTDYGRTSCFTCGCAGMPPYTLAYGYYVDGPNADLSLDLCSFSVVGGVGAYVDNGAKLRATACSFLSGLTAFEGGSGGSNSRIYISGSTIGDGFTYDVKLNTSTGTTSFNGVGHRHKLVVPEGSDFSASFTDPTDGYQGQVVLGELWFGTVDHSFALGSYSKNVASSGLLSGGSLSIFSGLDIVIGEGYGYINDGTIVHDVEWADSYLTLPASSEQFWVTVDSDGYVSTTIYEPDDTQLIVLGVSSTGPDSIYLLTERSVFLTQNLPSTHVYYRDVIGPISVSGCVVTKHETTSLQLDVDSGTYYIYDNRKEVGATSPITFTYWYRNGSGGWLKVIDQTSINPDGYDDGSGVLASVPDGKYKGDLLYVVKDGGSQTYHCIYSQGAEDEAGDVIVNPIAPEILNKNALRLARIVVQKGSSDITSISDQRPKLGQLSSGSTSVTKHGDLTGLESNDHIQYQLRTEKNVASGYCGLESNSKILYSRLPFTGTAPTQITVTSASIGTSNQICFSDHVHSVSTAIASDLVVGGSSSAGVATSLIRSDHNHALPAFGTTLGTFCQGNDVRLSDDRTASGLRSATTIVLVSSAAAPSAGQFLKATSSTAATWQTVTVPVVSDTNPVDILVRTASPGTSADVSRVDHAHNISIGTPVSVGTSNSDGTATSLSRSDHSHSGLTRGANDFNTFTLKSTLASSDVILLEDSAASGVKKYTTFSSFHGDFSNGGDVSAASRSLGNNSAYDLYLRTNSSNVLQVASTGEVRILGVNGYIYSERYVMGGQAGIGGPDLSCIPVVGGQSVITTWWGMQLVGNKQSTVEYTPSNYGGAGDFSVIIPNQQAAAIGLVIQGQTGQTGDLVRWRNSSSVVLSKVTSDGLIVAPNINNCRRVRVATTGAITLTAPQTIDGISVVAGDLVLVKNQGTGSQNGIYVVNSGAWTYANDWQTGFVFAETYVTVSEGTLNGHTAWRVNNTGTITVGTTAIVFTRMFLSRDAGDFNSFTEKTSLSAADIFLIEDSADTYNKKKISLSNFPKKWPFSKVLTVDATDVDADYSTIQAAINAASAGMTILINPGVYAETISLKDGVDLIGVGGSGIGYPTTTTNGVWIVRTVSSNTDLVTLSSGSCSLTNIGIKLIRSTGTGIYLRALVFNGTKLQLKNCYVGIDGGTTPTTCDFISIHVVAGDLTLTDCEVVAATEYILANSNYGLYIGGAGTTQLYNSRFTPDVSTTIQSCIGIGNASAIVNMNGCYVQGDCVRTSGTLNLYGGNQLDYGVSGDPIDGTGASFKQWDAVRIDGSNDQYKLNLKTITGDISSPSNGDVWYNNTTGKFRGRENGTSYDLISSTSVFGAGYTFQESTARSTTTSTTYQTKVTLTTPSAAGTYMVMFSCVIDNLQMHK